MTQFTVIWYLIPCLLTAVLGYRLVKQEEGKLKNFLTFVGLSIVPIINIAISAVLSLMLLTDFIKNGEKIQKFLNRKL